MLLPIALSIIIPLATAGPRIGLRALEEATRTLRASGIQFVLTIVGGVTGALVAGTVGAAWGLALGTCLAGIAWWVELVQATHEQADRIALAEATTSPDGTRRTPDGDAMEPDLMNPEVF